MGAGGAVGSEPFRSGFHRSGLERHRFGHDLGRHTVIGLYVGVELAGRFTRIVGDGHGEIDAGGNAVGISTRPLGSLVHGAKT